jgi:TrwC relaxase
MTVTVSRYSRPQPFSEESNAPGVRSLTPTKAGGKRRVVADIAKLSVGREAYYTRELATDHEQYLSGHGESPGRWYGAGATSLGLQGEASPA